MVDDARSPDEEVQDQNPDVAHRILLQAHVRRLQNYQSVFGPLIAPDRTGTQLTRTMPLSLTERNRKSCGIKAMRGEGYVGHASVDHAMTCWEAPTHPYADG